MEQFRDIATWLVAVRQKVPKRTKRTIKCQQVPWRTTGLSESWQNVNAGFRRAILCLALAMVLYFYSWSASNVNDLKSNTVLALKVFFRVRLWQIKKAESILDVFLPIIIQKRENMLGSSEKLFCSQSWSTIFTSRQNCGRRLIQRNGFLFLRIKVHLSTIADFVVIIHHSHLI